MEGSNNSATEAKSTQKSLNDNGEENMEAESKVK